MYIYDFKREKENHTDVQPDEGQGLNTSGYSFAAQVQSCLQVPRTREQYDPLLQTENDCRKLETNLL